MNARLATTAAGTVVTIKHDGHPLSGQTVTVGGNNGATGGAAGGGAVYVTDAAGAVHAVSRYTMVTV